MYIKSITLDGFKSYGKRTEITGFDQLFNAITGLNGSGKSNILDAICFTLGLSNMSLARCNTLRELIYKNGQAGVTKAWVSITFDNTDKAQTPTGYEHLNEIVIRREVNLNCRTKYYVNGITATNAAVSDLFHSVQLNISNPHFLIMQGRITKVLNMKPHDILAMIEEATGVSMYEAKKKKTREVIEKKAQHLRAIDLLIDETIVPKLEQLRKEHEVLLDYQKLVGELEKLSKQLVAWQFSQFQQKADHATDLTNNCNSKIEKLTNNIAELESKQEDASRRIVDIERHNDELSGGQLAELEERLKSEEKVETKEVGVLEKLTDSLEGEKKKRKDLEKQLSKDDQLLRKKQQEYDDIRKDFDKIEQDYSEADAANERAQRNYQAVVAGKALDEQGEAATSLADQLMKAEEEFNGANTEIKISQTKLTNHERDLAGKRSEANKHKAQYDEDNKHIASLEADVESIRAQLDAFGFDETHYNDLKGEVSTTSSRLQEVRQQLASDDSSSRLTFEYSPIAGFDPKCVRGPICNLFELKDPQYARAIEAAAGGRLYDIVVNTNDQCKEILDKGNLKRRHNLIALNKVQGRAVDRRDVEAAKKVANDKNVVAIIDLIEFDPAFKPAMQYVFGDTIVAPDVDKAMKITYSNLRKRTVTLDGDVMQPGGDMSGGAVSRQESFLVTLTRLKTVIRERSELEEKLRDLQTRIASMDGQRREYLKLESEFKHRSSKLEVIRNRLQLTSTHHQLFEAVKQLEIEISELKNKLVELHDTSEKSSKKVKELTTKLKNKEQSHKKELDAAEKALAHAKKDLDTKKKLIDQRKGKVESLRLEIEDLGKSCEQYKESIDKLVQVIEEKQKEVDAQSKVVDEARARVREVTDLLKEQKNKLREQNDEINKLMKERDKMGTKINEKRLEIKKIQHEIEQIESDARDASATVKAMLRKHNWIAEERHLFGKENTDYPFFSSNFDIDKLNSQVQMLTQSKNSMSKTVNQRANMMLGDKEQEADKLRGRRTLIEKDRDKLIKYMEEVDRKKKDALHKAWQKINRDFDSIFSTFLPNTHAKLDLVPGKDLLHGLEVKVAFGDVWKESLTELSGGQRSLVALSLILSLLKFNPAPLYILDEVDAALDQNHTQNTGSMIKQHFNKSQFIIVSLKDDMFRNANVLFKTRFVDGKSTVTRYTHNSKG